MHYVELSGQIHAPVVFQSEKQEFLERTNSPLSFHYILII
jgi:hypothetical protein